MQGQKHALQLVNGCKNEDKGTHPSSLPCRSSSGAAHRVRRALLLPVAKSGVSPETEK